MTSKSEAGDALSKFVEDIGIPEVVVVDGAQEQVGKNMEFSQTCKFYKIQQRQTEPYTPRQNQAEAAIREVKKRWCNKMHAKVFQNGFGTMAWSGCWKLVTGMLEGWTKNPN